MDGLIESEEAARRLGVKRSTLYVYVSRGLLSSHRSANGRRSLFDLKEIEHFAERSRGGKKVESRIATIATSITRLDHDGPSYRGIPATSLTTASQFEAVAELLWQAEPSEWKSVAIKAPTGLPSRDLIPCVIAMTAANDPLRSDLRRDAIVHAARQLITTIATTLSGKGQPRDVSVGIATSLARYLHVDASPDVVELINTCLILLADHELATSTVAVRIAASTHADVYDAMLAGLGVFGGPFHGAASQLMYQLVADASLRGPEKAINDALLFNRHLVGFGHKVYRSSDARFECLYLALIKVITKEQRDVLDGVIEVATQRSFGFPNIDLALAALVYFLGADKECGPTIFTVARIAGWVAHYLEELQNERPLRFRPRAVYVTHHP